MFPCTFEFLISATPYLQPTTLGVPLGRLGGKTPTDIDTAEESRLAALLHNSVYLQSIRRYHDKSVQERSFQLGDLVLRRIQNPIGLGKLKSPWEGLFLVSKVVGPGTYRLQMEDGQDIPNARHIEHLWKFYP